MAKKTTKKDSAAEVKLLETARTRARISIEGWKHNFEKARADIEFLDGQQWPDEVAADRSNKGRPMLTLNKLPQYVDQVLGDQRQNRPAISVHPVQDNASGGDQDKLQNTAGNADYSLAEVYNGLIRNIEYASKAEAHYDTAFQHSVEGGFGWLRVYPKYSDNKSFDQDLCIKAVRNRFSVIADHRATEPDYSDMAYCFIGENVPRSEFNQRWPDASVGDISSTSEESEYSWWVNEDNVRVAEYFNRKETMRVLLQLSDQRVVWEDEVKDVLDELERDHNVTVTRTRRVKTYRVEWYKITAFSVLEGPVKLPISTIPVVPVLGKEMTIGDRIHYRGLIRHSKDAQRMHNYWMTAATERVALAPKAPYVGPAEAFEGHEEKWRTANTENHAYLPYNAIPGVDRPQRDAPPAMPVAEIQLALTGTDEMKETMGLYDASLGAQGNETSGRAILARQRQGDRGTFSYIDNLSRAIARVGKILVDWIPYVYDSERVIRLQFEDGTGDWVRINQTIIDEESKESVLIHDITAGQFDVVVTAGPSYQTQRMEAADSLLQFVNAVPAAGQVIMDKVAENMDWPGAKEIAKRLKKILPAGILDQDEMEEEGIEAPQATPEQQVAMAESDAKMAQAQADTAKAEADTAKAQADLAMAQAREAEAQLKLREIEQAAMMGGPGSDEEWVRAIVADALAELAATSQG